MNWFPARGLPVAVMLLTLSWVSPAPAEIVGSAHDFLQKGWNTTGEVCATCHVSHDAGRDLGSVGLLWNHGLSTATYDIYQGFALENPIDQPLGPSKMCLGCHDGTVALDSFGPVDGSTFISGDAFLGTDLSATHPISIQWTHRGGSRDCQGCHTPHSGSGGMFGGPLKFIEGRVECPTCHEPHNDLVYNPGGAYLLRLDNSTSGLCRHCHGK